jgi:hypothetical protein
MTGKRRPASSCTSCSARVCVRWWCSRLQRPYVCRLCACLRGTALPDAVLAATEFSWAVRECCIGGEASVPTLVINNSQLGDEMVEASPMSAILKVAVLLCFIL